MKLPTIVKTAVKFVRRNDTFIMTIIAVSAGVGSTLSAIGATIKATNKVKEYKEINGIEDSEPLPLKDVAKISWHLYIPTIFLGASSVACIIGSHKLNDRRQAALASMYSITETAFKEYKEKVVETLGEKKAQVINEETQKELAKKHKYDERTVVFSDFGETLFLDSYSGRYFKSDIEKIRKTQNALNHKILTTFGNNATVNELYSALGLDTIPVGDELGWNSDKLIDLEFTAAIQEETGRPYIIMSHGNFPYNYESWQY